MATFEFFNAQTDKKTQGDVLEQLIDVIGNDVSSSVTRRKYQVWVTGSGTGPGVTSSLFQTIFDQDYTLQTANPVFDATIGLHTSSLLVQTITTSYDTVNDQYYFPSTSLMMREKIDIYRTFAQQLLGNDTKPFTFISGSFNGTSVVGSSIKEALFFSFKRLFSRDQLKNDTYALRMFYSGSAISPTPSDLSSSGTAEKIYTDLGSSTNRVQLPGGFVGTLVDTATTNAVGLIWHDQGIIVLDASKVFDPTQTITGSIQSVTTLTEPFNGSLLYSGTGAVNALFASASIDDVLDYVCSTRFTGSDATVMAFQNQTNINSSVYFCKFSADRFNYSSNPTYTDNDGRIVVIDAGQEDIQRSFAFITSIGLYDADNNLLAVAKTSRPILKNFQREYTVKVRLDYARKKNIRFCSKKSSK
jgi:hypothetical protein